VTARGSRVSPPPRRGGDTRSEAEPDPTRRSASAHRAILDAANALMLERGYAAVTIEGIAARAGVGKQTIYRWWRSKNAVMLDMLVEGRKRNAPSFEDTGDFGADLSLVLCNTVRAIRDPSQGPLLRAALGDAQIDQDLHDAYMEAIFRPTREAYRRRLDTARENGEIADNVTDDVLLDMAFGPIWFRALTRPATLTTEFAAEIASRVAASVRPPS
jgi:AcrR family transcriptional regulator